MAVLSGSGDYRETTLPLGTGYAGALRTNYQPMPLGGSGHYQTPTPCPPASGALTTGQLWPQGQSLPDTHTHANPALPSRQVVQFTTNAVNPNAEDTGTVPLAVGYRLMRVITSVPARVRLYVSTAARTADAPRPAGQDPTGDHGLVLEHITTYSDLDWILTPVVDGYSASGSSVPWSVTNMSNANSAVAVSLTWIPTED